MSPTVSRANSGKPEDPLAITESQLNEIRDSVTVVRKSLRTNLGIDLPYDAKSVEWLDGYINRLRTGDFDETGFRKLAQGFGSYLGEAIIAVYGGSWVRTDTGFGVLLKGKRIEYPFHRVVKQIEVGSDESIYRYFKELGDLPSEE